MATACARACIPHVSGDRKRWDSMIAVRRAFRIASQNIRRPTSAVGAAQHTPTGPGPLYGASAIGLTRLEPLRQLGGLGNLRLECQDVLPLKDHVERLGTERPPIVVGVPAGVGGVRGGFWGLRFN